METTTSTVTTMTTPAPTYGPGLTDYALVFQMSMQIDRPPKIVTIESVHSANFAYLENTETTAACGLVHKGRAFLYGGFRGQYRYQISQDSF